MPSNSVDSSLTQLHFTLLNKYIRINGPRRRLTLDVSKAFGKSWTDKLSIFSPAVTNF
jgi:hypothetical protein